ncbi:MAG: Hsp20/alpha crystallin family protein [Thermoleophilia bacterium]|nr:Hsp20/alpha crystallin family protein [Thermoleophilia bacterium]
MSADDLTRELRRMQDELDELFADMRGRPPGRGAPAVRAQADVFLTADPPTLTVQLDIAGVDPAEVDVQLEGDLLVIRGERRRPQGERRVYRHAEIDWGRFERRLRLGVPVDVAAARASYDQGMLTVALPLTPPRGPATVPVRTPGQS